MSARRAAFHRLDAGLRRHDGYCKKLPHYLPRKIMHSPAYFSDPVFSLAC